MLVVVCSIACGAGLWASACGKDAPNPAATGDSPADALTPAPSPPTPLPTPTLRAFFAAGAPTFVVGDSAGAKAQATFFHDFAFPRADLVDAASVAAWPARPVVYGGPSSNALLARIESTLPFTIGPDALTIAGETFTGQDLRLIAVVPASGGPAGHPEFVLYAGTGPHGLAEINAVAAADQVVTIADAFGVLATGAWTVGADGRVVAKLGPRQRRIAWRARGQFRFPAMLAAQPDEDALVAAGERGLARSAAQLGLADPAAATAEVVVYVYPDHGSKRSLTGDPGDGHAVAAASALHLVQGDASVGGGVENLVVHEGTHVLAYAAWGQAGTSLMGEGLAVWVSGAYGGTPLAEWAGRIREGREAAAHANGNLRGQALTRSSRIPSVHRHASELLGGAFRATPERESYPLAGLFVAAAIELVGRDNVRAHLFGATPLTWEAACRAAGTTPAALDEALEQKLAAARVPP